MRFTNKIKIFTTCLLLSFIFIECGKKYPDDPFLTPRSSKRRLEKNANHFYQWTIEKILINGQDVTNLYNDSIQPRNLRDIHFRFDFDYDPGSSSTRYDFIYLNYWETSRTLNPEISVWETYINPKAKTLGFRGPTSIAFKIRDTAIHKKLSNLLFYSWNIKKLWKKKFEIITAKNTTGYEVFFTR